MMEYLQTRREFWLSLLAGLIAGGIFAALNAVLVWSYTSALADIEFENLAAQGNFAEEEFGAQLGKIYYAQLYVPIVIGLGAGAALGSAFVFGKIRIGSLKEILIAVGIMWFVLYVIPAAKYPTSPEATFDPDETGIYQKLLLGYSSVSGLAALAIALGFQKIKIKQKTVGAAAIYFVVVAGAFFAFPDYHGESDSLLAYSVVSAWRSVSSLSMTIFWFSLGLLCHLLWLYGSRHR